MKIHSIPWEKNTLSGKVHYTPLTTVVKPEYPRKLNVSMINYITVLSLNR